MERLKHTAVLRQHLPMAGRRIADVGCGDGALVRFLTRDGAQAIGLDNGAGQLARARAAAPVGGEIYVLGSAEALPFAAGSLDAVAFFNALHHVPVELQDQALAEAARVVRPGGLVYVQEPVAAGAYFELMRPVEDETEVRARAYDAVKASALGETLELDYLTPIKHHSFEALVAQIIAVDETRRLRVEAQRESLQARFEATAERRDGVYCFDQPCRLNLLTRA